MTLLAIISVLSLLTIVGIMIYAHARQDEAEEGKYIRSIFLEDFVREELHRLVDHLLHFFKIMKPHTSRLSLTVTNYGKRGHTAFFEKLFGRRERERGKTASFFLKYIAEHKENIRSGTPERVGY